MDHDVMLLVLACLSESRSATSGEVAETHSFISREYVSMVLTRCYRRGFVSRRPYKRGRVRGYVYELTNKGAEWVFYKNSQWKRAKEDAHKTAREVEKEGKSSPLWDIKSVESIRKKPITEHKDFMSMEVQLHRWLVYVLWSEYKSLKQRYESLKELDDLAFLVLLSISNDRDAWTYACWIEREEKLELLERLQCRERSELHVEYSKGDLYEGATRLLESYQRGWFQGFRLGLQLGEQKGAIIAQGEFLRLLLKNHLSRKQKEEAFQARRLCYYVNERWWDLLSPGYNSPPLPVRGPARG